MNLNMKKEGIYTDDFQTGGTVTAEDIEIFKKSLGFLPEQCSCIIMKDEEGRFRVFTYVPNFDENQYEFLSKPLRHYIEKLIGTEKMGNVWSLEFRHIDRLKNLKAGFTSFPLPELGSHM